MFPRNKSLLGVLSTSIIIALVSYRFLFLDLNLSFPDMGVHINSSNFAFMLHILFAPIALLIGAIQFLPGFRKNNPSIHRWNGRLYALSILIAGGAAIVLSWASLDRPIAALGFGILAVVWICFTAIAIRFAMNRNITFHRRWMIRSFALTFAAVTLRVYLPFFFFVFDMDYAQTSNYVAWLCWVPNLIFAEWYIARNQSIGALA